MKKIIASFTLVLLFNIANAQSVECKKILDLYKSNQLNEVVIQGVNIIESQGPDADPEIYNIIGRAFFDLGNYDSSLIYLNKSIESENIHISSRAWSYNYLAKCYLKKSQPDLAKEYFYKSFNLKATKNVTNSSYGYLANFGLLDFYNDWIKKESENFVFLFQDSTGIDQFINARENAFDYISDYLDVNLNHKILYVVWTSREDAKKILNKNIGFSVPREYLIHSKINQTPGHEITHVISHYIPGITYKTGLINEGLAVYLDMADKNDKNSVLQAMQKYGMKKISIKSFWNNWNKYSEEISYPLAGLFIADIIEKYGKDKFIEFFKDQSYKNAKTVFGKDFDDFIQGFESKFN